MITVKTLLIVAVLVAVLVVGRPAFAQTAQQTPQRETDPIAALTAEFRALRAELSAAAAASLRLQLLVARLQAQEQRIIYLDRLRSEAATRRSNASGGATSWRARCGRSLAQKRPWVRKNVVRQNSGWRSSRPNWRYRSGLSNRCRSRRTTR